MYARTSIIHADPGKIEDGITLVRDQILPTVSSIDGCIGMSLLVDRDSGRCVATTAWDTEQALQSSAATVRPLRDQAEQALGAGASDVASWEVAAVHRDHAVPEGACARVTWVTADPATADRAVDIYKMVVLPKVQAFDGFCSASLMINRENGRAVGTVTFDSREQLEATREAASRLRELATGEMGATVDEVAEMEVAFAHLHVPEMA